MMLFVERLWELLLPRPLQSYFFLALGVQLFQLAAFCLQQAGVDVPACVGYSWGGERLLFDLSQVTQFHWAMYCAALGALRLFSPGLVVGAVWVVTLGGLLLPGSALTGALRQALRNSLLRTINPFVWHNPTPLSDVLMGDVLTSYSKIFAEWDALIFCFLLGPGGAPAACLPSLLSVLLVW